MDARITKQRLANMLAYDWLKIVGAILLAAVVFCVFFMMIGTRPTDGQCFYVYAYDGLDAGADFNSLETTFNEKGVFSYEILKTGSETFSTGGMYGDSVFTARRSTGEGRVMFVSDVREKDEETGKETSSLLGFLDKEGTEKESFGMFLDPEKFLEECETYLVRFFGTDLSGELNEKEARAVFTERNGKDKRFRSAAKKEEGVSLEIKRLNKLKEDYLSVKAAMGDKLDYVTYETETKTHTVGFSMKSLNLTSLVYYTVKAEGEETESKRNDDIVLCLFNNGEREGDLKYETVNFLAHLLRTYGTAK